MIRVGFLPGSGLYLNCIFVGFLPTDLATRPVQSALPWVGNLALLCAELWLSAISQLPHDVFLDGFKTLVDVLILISSEATVVVCRFGSYFKKSAVVGPPLTTIYNRAFGDIIVLKACCLHSRTGQTWHITHAELLSSAGFKGFCYTGRHDEVKCWTCGRLFGQWERTNNKPLLRQVPKCHFIADLIQNPDFRR